MKNSFIILRWVAKFTNEWNISKQFIQLKNLFHFGFWKGPAKTRTGKGEGQGKERFPGEIFIYLPGQIVVLNNLKKQTKTVHSVKLASLFHQQYFLHESQSMSQVRRQQYPAVCCLLSLSCPVLVLQCYVPVFC